MLVKDHTPKGYRSNPCPVVKLLRGDDVETCSRCKRPLIEIDHYGERLIGCLECNRLGWPGQPEGERRLAPPDFHQGSMIAFPSSANHKTNNGA